MKNRITVRCTECGTNYRVRAALKGKHVHCKRCRSVIEIGSGQEGIAKAAGPAGDVTERRRKSEGEESERAEASSNTTRTAKPRLPLPKTAARPRNEKGGQKRRNEKVVLRRARMGKSNCRRWGNVIVVEPSSRNSRRQPREAAHRKWPRLRSRSPAGRVFV